MNTTKNTHHAFEKLTTNEANQLENNLWWIQGRKKIIRHHLETIVSCRGKLDTIMDIGCGSGTNLDILSKFGKVIGVEPSSILAERSRAKGIANDIFTSEVWDVDINSTIQLFTMFDVIEHIQDDVAFLTKLKQKIPHRHTLLLSVPACPFLFGEHDRLLNHYRRYTYKMLNECLIKSGYRPISITYHMFFLFPAIFFVRLFDHLISYFGINRKQVNIGHAPPLLNKILKNVVIFESALSHYIKYPFGLWLFCIAESDHN